MRIDDPAEVPDVSRSREPVTVLHVDDNPDFLDLSSTFLERVNDSLTVETATTIEAALDRLEGGDVDCVVSDYDMPDRNGLEFLRLVRDRYGDLPFVLFTGKGSEEIASEAISAGVTDYLQKGPGTDQYAVLANRVANAVRKHDAERMVTRAYQAMDTAREGIALLDEDGEFQYVNQAYTAITGYDRDELVGKHWELLYPEGHVGHVYEEILPAVPRDGRWTGRTVYERKDGEQLVTDHALAYADDGTLICLVRQATAEDARHSGGLGQQPFWTAVDDIDAYAVVTVGEEGHVTGWNDGAERLFGYTEREILGTDVAELYTDEERSAALRATARERGTAADDSYRVGEDGEQFRAHTVVSAVGDGRGFVELVRGGVLDTATPTESHVLEDALDSLEDVFYVLDEDGALVYVNEPRGGELTRANLDSLDPASLFHPDDREQIEAGIQHALDTGHDTRELRFQDGDEYCTHEFRTWTLDGADDESRHVVGIGRDVSERKDRELALNDLHQTTQDLMRADSTDEIAAITVDALSDILTLTQAAVHQRIEGESALEPIAWTSNIEDVLGTPPTLGTDSLAWKAYERGEFEQYDDLQRAETLHNESTVFRSELIVPLGDHGVVLVASTDASAFDANDRQLAQLLCENVTAAIERVEREAMLRQRESELQRENERLDEFASLVSHDLRNPLSVADGHLELASEECDTSHIETARRAIDRMGTLIDDVLTLAREGESVDTAESVALSTVASQSWENVGTGDAEYRLADDVTVVADQSRLSQVFENLFRNAVEHGSTDGQPADGDHLTITVGAIRDGDGDPRGFYVEDDGVGIPANIRDRVFEAGYSTDDAGTGFGLRIVRDIVEAHGWQIACTASEAGGARFEITGVDAQ
ncbi:PAS/PAC sensor hybrid histidine kinase [Haloplanus vescus]|uniref:histidine kinase n=1 Tax=Haloplanus vescus TaxID=555874 RepID=A0A1H3WTP5_9EURY|nr:PAS domain S-box protein [Haloplanus vescus]SDZ90340.1 PAS/PAC sensor hybrid histidine kinase [Haloplanus vescus]